MIRFSRAISLIRNKRFWFSPEAIFLIMSPNTRIMGNFFYIPEHSTCNFSIMFNSVIIFNLFSKVQFLCSTMFDQFLLQASFN